MNAGSPVPLSEEKEMLVLRIEVGERVAALAKETGFFGNRCRSGAPPIGEPDGIAGLTASADRSPARGDWAQLWSFQARPAS
jgi:hypothetical protein